MPSPKLVNFSSTAIVISLVNVDCGDFAVTLGEYSPGLRQPRHTHDYSNVTVVAAGEIVEHTDAGAYHARPSSVVLKGAGCEHEDRVSGLGAKTVTIRFASDSAFGSLIGERTWGWFDHACVVRAALGLHRAFASGAAPAIAETAATLIEEVVASSSHEPRPPAWVARIRAALDEQFDQSIRFDSLARDHGLHPVYASRAFRRYVGVTMREYVRDLRMREARRELSSSRRQIAAIAALSGFADASHLSRTFTTLLGVTPKTYRRLTRG